MIHAHSLRNTTHIAFAAATLLLSLPAQAAEKLGTLLQQMRAQLDQDQLQIDALKRQLDGFQKRIPATVVPFPSSVFALTR